MLTPAKKSTMVSFLFAGKNGDMTPA